MEYDKIVFDDFTDYWHIQWNFNKIISLDSIRVIDMFWRKLLLKCEVNLIPKMIKCISSWNIIIDLG